MTFPFSDLNWIGNFFISPTTPTTTGPVRGKVEYAGTTNYGSVQFRIIRSWFIHKGTGGIQNGSDYLGPPSTNGPEALDAALSSSTPPKSWFWICTGNSGGGSVGSGAPDGNTPADDDVGILYWSNEDLYESDGASVSSVWTQGNGGGGNYCVAGVNPYA